VIQFMIGPPENLTEDHTHTQCFEDVSHAKEYYAAIIDSYMDTEDIMPGGYLLDTETGRCWRITVSVDVENVEGAIAPSLERSFLGPMISGEEAEALNREANLEMGIDPIVADGDWGNK